VGKVKKICFRTNDRQLTPSAADFLKGLLASKQVCSENFRNEAETRDWSRHISDQGLGWAPVGKKRGIDVWGLRHGED